jgi:hypothetical protein
VSNRVQGTVVRCPSAALQIKRELAKIQILRLPQNAYKFT